MQYITDLEVANKALLKLGQRPIDSFDEQNEAARTVKAIYSSVRDAEISVYRWNFAVRRAVLPQDKEAPAFGYKAAYTLPTDFLRLEAVCGLTSQSRNAWTIENNKILTDLKGPLKIIYLSRQLSTVSWPPYFVEAFACRLAFELCERLRQDPARKNILMQEYQLHIQNAKRANAIQLPAQALEVTEWERTGYEW